MASASDEATVTVKQEKTFPSSQSIGDLDEAIQHILKWDEQMKQLVRRNDELNAELKAMKTKNDKHVAESSNLKTANSNLLKTIENLQEVINLRMNDEDEVKVLREQIISTQDLASREQEEMKGTITDLQNSLTNQQVLHRKEIDCYKSDMIRKSVENDTKCQAEILKIQKNLEAKVVQGQEKEKQHESATIKMQMEYEAKISVLQAKISRTQVVKPTNSFTNNDIFKKKLQHIQEEKNKQITQLKSEITWLRQHYMPGHNTVTTTPVQNQSSASSSKNAPRSILIKRKRPGM